VGEHVCHQSRLDDVNSRRFPCRNVGNTYSSFFFAVSFAKLALNTANYKKQETVPFSWDVSLKLCVTKPTQSLTRVRRLAFRRLVFNQVFQMMRPTKNHKIWAVSKHFLSSAKPTEGLFNHSPKTSLLGEKIQILNRWNTNSFSIFQRMCCSPKKLRFIFVFFVQTVEVSTTTGKTLAAC